MECKIESNFYGFINGVPFHNENAFFVVYNILAHYEDAFGKYDDKRIVEILEEVYNRYVRGGRDVTKMENDCIKNLANHTVRFLPRSKLVGKLNQELGQLNDQYETI